MISEFSLKQFEKDSSGATISGRIARRNNILLVSYELIGNLQNIDIPGRKQNPSRMKGLWENTCFELFAAVSDWEQYWELNVSPSGDWNVFRFEHYEEERRIDNLREETLVTSLPSRTQARTQKQPASLSLDCEFNLTNLVRENQLLEIGISAVIKMPERTYWALTHCDSRPNFHRRDSFILRLR